MTEIAQRFRHTDYKSFRFGILNHSLQIQSSVGREAKIIYLVGQTTKHMTHGRSWNMEIGLPSVEDVTLELRPRVTCSTSGRHISMSHELPSVIC